MKRTTTEFAIDGSALRRGAKKKLCTALGGLAETDTPLLFELLLVSEEEIRRLNREQRQVDKITDVLSFPASDLVAGEPIRAAEHTDCVEPVMGRRKGEWVEKGARLFLGSVVICEKRAREQAEEYGHSYERELFYLAVHGVLHCLGYDHETEEERAVMREKEEYVMQKMGLSREI